MIQTQETVLSVQLVDQSGRVIVTAKPSASGRLNIPAVAPGYYVLRVQTTGGVITQKLLKQ